MIANTQIQSRKVVKDSGVISFFTESDMECTPHPQKQLKRLQTAVLGEV